MSSNIVPPISDGQPVTYEFLNQVVDAVNKLGKIDSEGSGQDITIKGSGQSVGYSFGAKAAVEIIVGRFSLEFASIANVSKSTSQKTIKIGGNFKSPPLIFLSPVDETAEKSATTSYISIVATNVSKTSFTCRARRTIAGKDAQKKDEIIVNFLAIGPTSS
jgi:hypothetical protein